MQIDYTVNIVTPSYRRCSITSDTGTMYNHLEPNSATKVLLLDSSPLTSLKRLENSAGYLDVTEQNLEREKEELSDTHSCATEPTGSSEENHAMSEASQVTEGDVEVQTQIPMVEENIHTDVEPVQLCPTSPPQSFAPSDRTGMGMFESESNPGYICLERVRERYPDSANSTYIQTFT